MPDAPASTLLATLLVLGMTLIPGAVAAGSPDCPPGLAPSPFPCIAPAPARPWTLGAPLPPDVAWYQVNDWDRFALPEPSKGSRYIMVDTEILLVAIATGIVLDVVTPDQRSARANSRASRICPAR